MSSPSSHNVTNSGTVSDHLKNVAFYWFRHLFASNGRNEPITFRIVIRTCVGRERNNWPVENVQLTVISITFAAHANMWIGYSTKWSTIFFFEELYEARVQSEMVRCVCERWKVIRNIAIRTIWYGCGRPNHKTFLELRWGFSRAFTLQVMFRQTPVDGTFGENWNHSGKPKLSSSPFLYKIYCFRLPFTFLLFANIG